MWKKSCIRRACGLLFTEMLFWCEGAGCKCTFSTDEKLSCSKVY